MPRVRLSGGATSPKSASLCSSPSAHVSREADGKSALRVHGLTQAGKLVGEALELRKRVAQQWRELVGEELLRNKRAVVRNGVQ